MRRIIFGGLCVLLIGIHVLAQDTACPQFTSAVEAAIEACTTVASDQACYGGGTITAQGQPWAADLTFAQTGDFVDVAQLQSLALTSSGSDASLVVAQFRSPNAADALVTVAAFGTVRLDWAEQPAPLEISATSNVNVRAGPGKNYASLGKLAFGTVVLANARDADNTWLRFVIPDTDQQGWVAASLVKINGDIRTLPILDAVTAEPLLSPFQNFTLTMPAEMGDCPTNGLLIQVPAEAGWVKFQINGVTLRIGSTVWLATQDEALHTTVLEGHSIVTAGEHIAALPAGGRVIIHEDVVDFDPYTSDDVAELPLALLTPIDVAAPLDADAFAAAQLLPLAGTWRQDKGYAQGTGGADCPISVTADAYDFELTVGEDGSISETNPYVGDVTFNRVSPGVYGYGEGTLQIVSPAQMVSTHDAASAEHCVMMLTITSNWQHP